MEVDHGAIGFPAGIGGNGKVKLNKRGLVYLLKDIILDLCGFDPEQEAAAAYSSAYAAFFLYGWIEVWFRRGMKETAAELAGCLKSGMNGIV